MNVRLLLAMLLCAVVAVAGAAAQTSDFAEALVAATFDPRTPTWQVTWFNPVTGAFDVLHTRMEGERIVQEGTQGNGRRLRWIFQEITDTSFHWTGEAQLPDGSWRLEAEFFGRRR